MIYWWLGVVYWATVCKTVRPMLSVALAVCPVCLSVMLVYCGQTAGWIQMKLGKEVGLGLGHTVLDGDPAPIPKGAQPPIFGPCCCGQTVAHLSYSATAEHLLYFA